MGTGGCHLLLGGCCAESHASQDKGGGSRRIRKPTEGAFRRVGSEGQGCLGLLWPSVPIPSKAVLDSAWLRWATPCPGHLETRVLGMVPRLPLLSGQEAAPCPLGGSL